jgi:hypothetical protein
MEAAAPSVSDFASRIGSHLSASDDQNLWQMAVERIVADAEFLGMRSPRSMTDGNMSPALEIGNHTSERPMIVAPGLALIEVADRQLRLLDPAWPGLCSPFAGSLR